MKTYIVKNTPLVEKKLDKYIGYLYEVKKSAKSANALLKDFVETRESLETSAGSLQNPQDENLLKRNLKRINFRRHNYFLLYRIKGNIVEIVSMFHGSENYAEKLHQEDPIF